MRVRVWDDLSQQFIDFELPEEFAEKTMLKELAEVAKISETTETTEVIELPREKVTYRYFVDLFSKRDFSELVQTYIAVDFLGIENSDLLKKIAVHRDFDPSAVAGYIDRMNTLLTHENREKYLKTLGITILPLWQECLEISKNPLHQEDTRYTEKILYPYTYFSEFLYYRKTLKNCYKISNMSKKCSRLLNYFNQASCVQVILEFLSKNICGIVIINSRVDPNEKKKIIGEVEGMDFYYIPDQMTTEDFWNFFNSLNTNKITILHYRLHRDLLDSIDRSKRNVLYLENAGPR